MFTLRKVTESGQQINISLGASYTVTSKDKSPDEFNAMLDHTPHMDETYAFVVSESGVKVYPLYKNQQNYIMSGSGKTFCNLTFKTSR